MNSQDNIILKVENLSKTFGGLLAVNRLDFEVKQGEILGIIGPNGAGKSTVINLISGFYPVSGGNIIFDGHDITKLKAHQISNMGIGRNFQASVLFIELPVIANVYAAFHSRYKTSRAARLMRLPVAIKEEREFRQKSLKILEKMGMAHLASEQAKNLPHGYQRILSICITLATNPRLLLLDEPLTGMNQVEIDTTLGLIRSIRDNGMTIVTIEHNIPAIMSICDRLVVLANGQKIAEGLPRDIQNNEAVIESYLGRE